MGKLRGFFVEGWKKENPHVVSLSRRFHLHKICSLFAGKTPKILVHLSPEFWSRSSMARLNSPSGACLLTGLL